MLCSVVDLFYSGFLWLLSLEARLLCGNGDRHRQHIDNCLSVRVFKCRYEVAW